MNFTFAVDTREKKKTKDFVLKKLEKFKNTELMALKAGDLACIQNGKFLVGIERKTMEDFVNSVSTKRIFAQVEKLHANYPVVIIILEGKMTDLRAKLKHLHLNFNEHAFWGTIASIVVRDNFTIFQSSNLAETTNMAYMICTKFAEGKYQIPRRWKPKSKNTPKDSLTLIPGVTDALAKLLLKKYNSISAISMLTQKELCTNKGVGSTLALRIKNWLT